MDNIGPLSTRQQLDALKIEQERAKLLRQQAEAQRSVNKITAEVPKAIEPVPQVPQTSTQPFDDSLLGHMINQESGGYHRNPKTGELTTPPVKKGEVPPKYPAKGILQWKGDSAAQPGYGTTPFDVNTADENTQINASRQYMTGLTKAFDGDLEKGLAAYNFGPGNLKKHIAANEAKGLDWKVGLPKETANYVSNIMGEYSSGNPNVGSQVPPVYRASINPRDTMKVPPVGPIDETSLVNAPTQSMPTELEVRAAHLDIRDSSDLVKRAKAQMVIDRANGVESSPEMIRAATSNFSPQLPSTIKPMTEGDNSSGGIDAADDPEAQAFAPISTNNLLAVPPLQDNADQVTPVTVDAIESGVVPPLDETDLPPLTSTQQKTIDSLGAAGGTVNPASIADTLVGVSGDSIIGGPNSGSEEDKAKLPDTFWKELSKSFKDLFTDKEFIRFGILLAGGMLTGGSFGGSLKYAGLYALQSADKREAVTAAATVKAKADAAKDLSDRGNAIDKSLTSALANTSIPDNERNFALQQMRKNDTLPLAQRVAANSDLLEGLNSRATNKKGYRSIQRVVDGVITDLYENQDTGTYSTRTVDAKGNVSFTVVPNTLSVDDFKKLNSDVRDAISSMVGAHLDPELKNLGDIKNNIAQQTLDATTHMTTFGSTIQAKDVAQMAKVAMNTVGTYIAGTDYAEWSSKYVGALYTQAAVRIAPTRKELFMNPEGLPLSAPAYARIRTELAGDKLEPGLARLIGEYEKYRDNPSTTKVNITLPNDGSLKVPKDVATYLNQNKAESPLTAYLHLRSLGKVGKVN